jgi:steroid 5-alpha reductase family enzyme
MDLIKGLATWPYAVIPVNFVIFSYRFLNPTNPVSGYGLSMFSNGALTLFVYRDQVNISNLQSVCHAGLSMLYGARLTEYLYRRQSKFSFNSILKERSRKTASASIAMKFISVSRSALLLSAYVIPLVYNFKYSTVKDRDKSWVSWLGVGLAAAGIILQLFGDEQKLRHKETVGGCIMDGVYKFIRHPNYTGEVLFHVGMYLGGLSAYQNRTEMLNAAITPGLMTLVMALATKFLDIKQIKKYGDNPDYNAWKKRTWSLIPLIY